MSSIRSPFPEAIALLDVHMDYSGGKYTNLFTSVLMKLGELPTSEATTMLTRALTHSNPEIRKSAAYSLARRRSRPALTALIDQYAKEDEESVAVELATAILASGANSALDLQDRHTSPAIQILQCILTMRLRDVGACQGSCRVSHAATALISAAAASTAAATPSRSGLSVTAPIGDQSRVLPDQRFGFA